MYISTIPVAIYAKNISCPLYAVRSHTSLWSGPGLKANTVNVDIFACMNFYVFMKMGNFTWIKICVLSITGT